MPQEKTKINPMGNMAIHQNDWEILETTDTRSLPTDFNSISVRRNSGIAFIFKASQILLTCSQGWRTSAIIGRT